MLPCRKGLVARFSPSLPFNNNEARASAAAFATAAAAAAAGAVAAAAAAAAAGAAAAASTKGPAATGPSESYHSTSIWRGRGARYRKYSKAHCVAQPAKNSG